MRIRLLPSGAVSVPGQLLSSFLINDTLAIDAGSLGIALPLAEQGKIRHLVLTHSHLDHLATLPMFLENIYGVSHPVAIHAHPATLESLHKDMFNDRLFPDSDLMLGLQPPFMRLQELTPQRTTMLEGLRITPFLLDHTVATLGFCIEDDQAGLVFASDTGPTDAILKMAGQTENLRAVYLEASFPNGMEALAASSKHLTTSQFLRVATQLPPTVAVIAIHLKARFAVQITAEIAASGLAHVQVAQAGQTHTW